MISSFSERPNENVTIVAPDPGPIDPNDYVDDEQKKGKNVADDDPATPGNKKGENMLLIIALVGIIVYVAYKKGIFKKLEI